VIAFSTPPEAARWKRWLVYSPLARTVIFALLISVLLFVVSLAVAGLGWTGKDAPVLARRFGFFLKQMVPALGAYLFLAYLIERRKPAELAWAKVLPHGLLGVAAGTLLISAVVGVLWLAGAYQVTGTTADVDWLRALFLAGIGTAVAEEIVFRGVLFRITEEGLGTWPALVISALLFGGLHAFNKGATAWSSAAIAIEAGLLLGLAYHVTRSLPLVMGFHAAWNFTQGTVFGIPVSGSSDPGWLVATRPGPDWLTGGPFGAEASVIAVALSLLASIAMAVHARRTGSVVMRVWLSRRIMKTESSQGAPC
jgi:membrane protease YdiL (CAAX protease family)